MLALAVILSVGMGLVLGLLGGGGSILTVPILLYVAGLPPKEAIASSLVVVGLTAVAGVTRHHRAGNVRFRLGLGFGAVAMVGAYAGGRLGALVPGPVLLGLFAGLMLLSSLGMLRGRRACDAPTAWASRISLTKILLLGLGVGLLTGLIGAGGGFIIVPALALVAGLSMREAVATSLLIIAMNSAAGLLGQLDHVHVAWGVAGLLSAASIAGSFAGVRLAARISGQHLRRAFGALVLVMGTAILLRQVPGTIAWLGRPMHLVPLAVIATLATGAVVWVRRARADAAG